ncbi:MAG: PH domain-containing protein [Patescibacteria group bacterium]
MSEYHFPVPGSEKEDEIVIFTRRHWIAFLGQFLLALFLLIVPLIIIAIVCILNFESKVFQGLAFNFIVLIFSAYYLIIATFIFISWISFYCNAYIITKAEIIEITQVGFFGRKISQLSLLRVQDVSSNIKGFLPTLFAYGDVLVETAGERETFLLQSVPNPQEISSKIMEIHDEIIETEGRHGQLSEGEGVLSPGKIKSEEKARLLTPEHSDGRQAQEKIGETNLPLVKNLTEEELKEKTAYQQLLEKDQKQEKEDVQEGEVSKDDLSRGGQIDLK